MPGLFEELEQAAGVFAGESFQAVRLSLLDRIFGGNPFGAKLTLLLLHQRLPAHGIEFAHEHVDAHFGDGLDALRSFIPQIAG